MCGSVPPLSAPLCENAPRKKRLTGDHDDADVVEARAAHRALQLRRELGRAEQDDVAFGQPPEDLEKGARGEFVGLEEALREDAVAHARLHEAVPGARGRGKHMQKAW